MNGTARRKIPKVQPIDSRPVGETGAMPLPRILKCQKMPRRPLFEQLRVHRPCKLQLALACLNIRLGVGAIA